MFAIQKYIKGIEFKEKYFNFERDSNNCYKLLLCAMNEIKLRNCVTRILKVL
jgi:hypothetical protein